MVRSVPGTWWPISSCQSHPTDEVKWRGQKRTRYWMILSPIRNMGPSVSVVIRAARPITTPLSPRSFRRRNWKVPRRAKDCKKASQKMIIFSRHYCHSASSFSFSTIFQKEKVQGSEGKRQQEDQSQRNEFSTLDTSLLIHQSSRYLSQKEKMKGSEVGKGPTARRWVTGRWSSQDISPRSLIRRHTISRWAKGSKSEVEISICHNSFATTHICIEHAEYTEATWKSERNTSQRRLDRCFWCNGIQDRRYWLSLEHVNAVTKRCHAHHDMNRRQRAQYDCQGECEYQYQYDHQYEYECEFEC